MYVRCYTIKRTETYIVIIPSGNSRITNNGYAKLLQPALLSQNSSHESGSAQAISSTNNYFYKYTTMQIVNTCCMYIVQYVQI